MSKPDTWMPLFIGDYLGDTTRFNATQHGAYLLLIMDYWRNGPPPDDDDVLATAARCKPAEWKRLRPSIAEKFEISEGVWHHKRIDEELASAGERKQKAEDKARRGAEARWGKHGGDDATGNASSNAPSIPQALPKQCPSPSPIPSSSRKTSPPKPPKGGNDETAQKTRPIAFATFLQRCKDLNEKHIPENDAVWEFAERAHISDELLRVHWKAFSDRYRESNKRYRDWRQVFRNSVKGNWFGVWRVEGNGTVVLSSRGELLRRGLSGRGRNQTAAA
jgi:uncharacterized protein YdaU (DUF1376 family)